jgi:hypothetical protein
MFELGVLKKIGERLQNTSGPLANLFWWGEGFSVRGVITP